MSSDPLFPDSSLPPSSAMPPSTNSRGARTNPTGSPSARRRQQQPADALALGDDEADENQDGEDASVRRRRVRGQGNVDVPLVKDAVGESVAESFEAFLKG